MVAQISFVTTDGGKIAAEHLRPSQWPPTRGCSAWRLDCCIAQHASTTTEWDVHIPTHLRRSLDSSSFGRPSHLRTISLFRDNTLTCLSGHSRSLAPTTGSIHSLRQSWSLALPHLRRKHFPQRSIHFIRFATSCSPRPLSSLPLWLAHLPLLLHRMELPHRMESHRCTTLL